MKDGRCCESLKDDRETNNLAKEPIGVLQIVLLSSLGLEIEMNAIQLHPHLL